MRHLFIFFCLAFFALFVQNAKAQFRYEYADLQIRTNTGMPLRYFFKDVIVLDNRIDTNNIYLTEDGTTPPLVVTFKESAPKAIKDYIKGRTGHLRKNNGTLLVNILQLRVPNRSFIKDRKIYSLFKSQRDRDFIFFSAEFYTIDSTGLCKKCVTIKEKMYSYSLVKRSVRNILDDIVEIAEQIAVDNTGEGGKRSPTYKSFIEDSLTFIADTDVERKPVEQVNVNVKERWKAYKIFQDSSQQAPCIYPLFEDFKNDQPVFTGLHLSFNAEDSTYELNTDSVYKTKKNRMPWAARDSNGLYIHLLKNKYLKMERGAYTFHFSIPATLPNMYQLLSEEHVRSVYANRGPGFGTTNALNREATMDLVADAVLELFALNGKQRKLNKIRSGADTASYRNCFIDMDLGDFIY